jgi:excinuclease UvrABC nuclease subunit
MTMTEVHKLPYKLQSENLPEVAAVYFIVNDLVPIYIGQSVNIRNRMKQHSRIMDTYNRLRIYYLEIQDNSERFRLESELISEFKPCLNVVRKELVGNSQLSQEQIIDLQDRGYRVTNEGYFKIKQLNNNKI